jgi:hypothetical protein
LTSFICTGENNLNQGHQGGILFKSPQMLVDRLNNGGRNSVGPLRGQLDTDKQHLPIPSSSFSLSQEGKKEKREGFFFFFSIE